MYLEGKVIFIGETTTHGNNGFRKRELVVETEEQYPQKILTEFVQDKCDVLDALSIDQMVKVSINLRGREWVNPQGETKYFNTIQGWKVEVTGVSNQSPPQQQATQPQDAFEPTPEPTGDDDDLPF